MPENTYSVLFSTTNTVEEARKIANHLVSNHIVACVNIVPSISSIYWWNNQVNEDQEVLMIIKTTGDHIAEVEKAIRSLHSYETPELIAFNLDYGLPEYLKWLQASVSERAK